MEETTVLLMGIIKNKNNSDGIAGLLVKAWDLDKTKNDILGEAITTDEGRFSIEFDPSQSTDGGRDPYPDVQLKIYYKDTLIHTTKPIKNWQPETGNPIIVDIEFQKIDNKVSLYLVLTTSNNQPAAGVQLVLNYTLPSGDAWSSERITSDASGRLAVDIPTGGNDTVDWSRVKYTFTSNNKALNVVNMTQPAPVEGGFGASITLSQPEAIEVRVVNGTVKADDGRSIFNVVIKLFNKQIGKEILLGTSKTNPNGEYRIQFKLDKKSGPKTKGEVLNYIVRVFDGETADTLLAASPMITSVRAHEVINLIVNRIDFRGISLYEAISKKMTALNLAAQYKDLNDDDAILIARQIGVSLDQVQEFIQANFIVSQSDKLLAIERAAEIVFGVLQAGLDATVLAFASIRDSELIEMIEQAMSENWIQIVPARSVVDNFRPARVDLLIDYDNTVADLIRSAGGTEDQLITVVDNYLNKDQSLFNTLQQLGDKGEIPQDTVNTSQDSISLIEFVGSDPLFLAVLRNDYGIKKPIELANLTSKDWLDISTQLVNHQAGYQDTKPLVQRASQLAIAFEQQVEKAFPTAVFSSQWGLDADMENAPVQVYLQNHPDFEFINNRLRQYWENKDNQPEPEAAPLLIRTERLFLICPDFKRFFAFKACWEIGIESARDVLDQGRGRFVLRIADYGIDESDANIIYRKAQRVLSHNLLLKDWVPIDEVDETTEPSSISVRVEPTISALFGAQGGNSCPHCISAFSPSAYLLDLLDFLKKAEMPNGTTGLDILFLRRPDIQFLNLDCANSDTVMLYIDLVNEILEHVVATSQIPFQVPADWMVEPSLKLQTTKTAEELAAYPENLQVEAYNRLRAITAPWSLPYNLWSDEVRIYLSQIKIDRTDLLTVFRPEYNAFTVLEIATERLAIDPAEALVISTPADTEAKRTLIWQSPDPAADLKDLRLFLKRTGLSYEQSADIFKTRFVNPDQRAIMPVNINKLDLATLDFNPGDNDGLLDRFHRFTRLWRKTGWSTLELDAVMLNLLTGDLDAVGLTHMGNIAELRQRYETPVEELASWYGNINTYGHDDNPALYQRQFLDGSVHGVVADGALDLLSDVFAIAGKGSARDLVLTKGPNLYDKWLAQQSTTNPEEITLHPDYSPIVMAGCKLTSDELTEILVDPLLELWRNKSVTLNLANLSQIFRTASIARSLGMSIKDCLAWQRMIGEPLGVSQKSNQAPSSTLSLLETVAEQINEDITADTLRYALYKEQIDGLSPLDTDISALLESIRTDLIKSTDQFRIDSLSASDQLRLWLSLDSSLLVTDTQNDIETVLTIIDGSVAFDNQFEPALGFLSAKTKNQLFNRNIVINKDERLYLAASNIPLDTNLLKQTQELLRADEVLDEASILELLRIFVEKSSLSESEQDELLAQHLPYLDYISLKNTAASNRLPRVNQVLFDHTIRKPLVVQLLADATSVSILSVELLAAAKIDNKSSLLQRVLDNSFLQEDLTAIIAATSAIEHLYCQCALVNALSMDASEIGFTLSLNLPMQLYDFTNSEAGQFHQWHSTVILHKLYAATSTAESSLLTILENIISGAWDEITTKAEIASLFGVTTVDMEVLVGVDALNFSFPTSYLLVSDLNKLNFACGLVKQTGVSSLQVLQLASSTLNTEHASIARAAVRSKYDEASWLKVSEQLRTGLRERQRDALLNFIVTRGAFDLSHEAAYAYYLIDTDMSACFQTTRTKQAIASIQQFIQRILLGLELEDLVFTKEDAKEWMWRKNYRVWEANVKVFAFPQNWLVPELRDDKTPLFKTFEQEILQGELTNELAETTVIQYLEKLHGISNLEIAGLYEQSDENYTLHVIGRTYNSPHSYYYRTYNSEIWSPWQPIEVDIEGLQIIPIVYNNRLYVFWPTYQEEINQNAVDETGIENDIDAKKKEIAILDGDESGDDFSIAICKSNIDDLDSIIDQLNANTNPATDVPLMIDRALLDFWKNKLEDKYAERDVLETELARLDRDLEKAIEKYSYQKINMNWIVQTQNGWSAKKTSKKALLGKEGKTAQQYQYMGTAEDDTLTIQVETGFFNFAFTQENRETVGLFRMQDCSGELVVINDNLPEPPLLRFFGKNSEFVENRHTIKMVNSTTNAENTFNAKTVVLLYDSPDDKMYVTRLHQQATSAAPFFLASGKRTFFVEKRKPGMSSSLVLSGMSNLLGNNPITSNSYQRQLNSQYKQNTAKNNEFFTSRQPGKVRINYNTRLAETGELSNDELGGVALGGDEKYFFRAHHHSYTCAFLRQIRRYGIKGFYSPEPALQTGRDAIDLLRQQTTSTPRFNFGISYEPNPDEVFGDPIDKIDFSYGSAYAQYNWEVFYHIPMFISSRLIQEQKFEQAQDWLHYIFDPTETQGIGLQKYWKIKPFYYTQLWGQAQDDLGDQLEILDNEDTLSLESLVDYWEEHPFQPYAISRFRIVSFMIRTVMTYLDNLIAWADSLFKRDTMESINEATQLYVLASTILGERPLVVDQQSSDRQTFTVLEFLEGKVSQSLPVKQVPGTPNGQYNQGAQGILGILDQFCLPYNERMLDYWDTIADRLFKIRHCLNLDGVFRKLPVFEPPIDPALLVLAAASGLDIGSVLADLSAPRPHYRFDRVVQKASEIVSLVQGIGSQLLAALEKQDAERLARLRSENEIALLKLTSEIREQSIKEAEEQLNAIELGKNIVNLRREYFAGREYMNNAEEIDMVLRGYSWYIRTLAQVAQAAVTPMEAIPKIEAGTCGPMPCTSTQVPHAADGAKSAVAVLNVLADFTQTAANISASIGQYDRRQEEWDYQVTLADAEIKQFEKQIAAARIRLAMAERELANHKKQIEYSEQAHAYLKDKYTNTELYSWMISELSGLYYQAYQIAYDMAKRAERCLQHELGIKNTNYIKFGYWDSLKKGLLAGEKLALDIKRMEMGYLEKNIRELELSKTVSLLALDPEALLRLTETGECFISLPEQLFDLDYPGHYFRRIKSIDITIPSITGPYTTLSCTLTLLSDRYRLEPTIGETESDFEWNVGAIQSIATSKAQGDSGTFVLDFRDERYLPFDNAGVISSWKINLPKPKFAQFDYSTISDVLIKINYTARDGGQTYRDQVEERLESTWNSFITADTGFPILVSLKNRFPDAWARLLQADVNSPQSIEFSIDKEVFPYVLRIRESSINSIKLLVLPKDGATLDFTGEVAVLNNIETVDVKNDPSIGVPSAYFTESIPLEDQNIELSSVVMQQIRNVKDMILVCLLNVKPL